jgi:carbon-monoxide dehydrogenase medium subunit
MTLPPFDLHRVSTADEARELLTRYGDDAAVICGGTELLLLMKLGFAAYGHLVDIRGIDDLARIYLEDGALVIGAAATHREIERSSLVREQLPALAAMERRVANIRVRAVGTLGGNLCFSDPHSDPATFLLALEAEVDYDGRRAPLEEFLVGPYVTALEQGQLLHRIRVPVPVPATGIAHQKLSFHERPAATVTCAVRVDAGLVTEARVAVGSVGPRAVRARAAEERLRGIEPIDEPALADAAALTAEAAGAVADANGSIEYKRQLVHVLVRRCFGEALGAREERGAETHGAAHLKETD